MYFFHLIKQIFNIKPKHLARAGICLIKESVFEKPHYTVIRNVCIKKYEAVQLLSCSDYYEQLHTWLSDKAKYGVFTKSTMCRTSKATWRVMTN